jgi:hypothetical protein
VDFEEEVGRLGHRRRWIGLDGVVDELEDFY